MVKRKNIRKTKDIVKEQKKTKLVEAEEVKRGITKKAVDIADLPRISREFEAEQARTPEAIAQRQIDVEQAKRDIITKKPKDEPVLGESIVIEKAKETGFGGVIEKTLDVISAPLRKPKTTFTEGIGAGAEAVRKSRERIREGDTGEAVDAIITIATTTGLLVGALLAGAGAAGTVKALTAKLAATTGQQAVVAGAGATKAALTGGAGLGLIFGIDKFVFSPNELGTWAAVDNVAGALSFQISELDNGVREGSVSPEKARIILSETKSTIDKMRVYITRQSERNPKLWASSKIFKEALDTSEDRVQQIELQIFGSNP